MRAARARFALPSWLVGTVAVLVLSSPLVFTRRALGTDWTNHLWMVWKQGIQFRALLHPSYFAHADFLGIFYPQYAYYGGTAYGVTGALASILGGRPVIAYVAVTVGAFAMAYGGWTWLARQAGLSGWRAHGPALVFTTAAYYLANLYGRGAWGEFMATSALPLALAAGIALVRAERWRVWPSTALVVSVVVLSGSHNITLLWSAVFLVLLAVVAAFALPRHGREIPARRLGRVALLGGLAVGVNLWFLLPDLFYASKSFSSKLGFQGSTVSFLDSPGLVFDPLRRVPAASGTPGLFVQLPVLALGWGLVAVALSWRSGLARFWRRLALGVTALMAVLLVFLFSTGAWDALPHTLRYIQFPYRLQTYVLMCLSGLVLIGLRTPASGRGGTASRLRRALPGVFAAIVLFGSVLAVWQIWNHRSDPPNVPPDTRDQVFASPYAPPPGWADPGNYRDSSAPVVAVPKGRSIVIPPAAVVKDRFAAAVALPPGTQPVATNIAAGPYFVHVAGVRRLGRTADGFMVVARKTPGAGPVQLSVAPAHPAPVVAGIVLSLLSLVVLLGLLGVGLRRSGALSEAAVEGYLELPPARGGRWLGRRLGLVSRAPASFTDTALYGGLVLLVGVVVFAGHIRHGGFYYDDWANYADLKYGGFGAWWDLTNYRPGTAIYVALTEWVFGLHMHFHLLWAVALCAAMSAALYHLLRMLGVARLHAGVIGALVLVFPYSDSTRLWAVAGLGTLAVLCFLGGAIASLYGLRQQGRRALWLHLLAGALYLASVLTYELTAAPLFLVLLLYRLRAPWRRALVPWAAQVGTAAVAVAIFNSQSNLHQVLPVRHWPNHVKLIAEQSLVLFSAALVPFGHHGRWLGLVLMAVIAGAALFVLRFLRPAQGERRELGLWLGVLLGGVIAIVAGYAMFVPADPYFSPGQLGVGNRVNIFAALGYPLAFYALARLACLVAFRWLPRPRVWALSGALVLSLVVGLAYVGKIEHDSRNWNAAYATEQQVLATVHGLVPRPAHGSMIYTFGHPAYYAPGVPVFAAQWDLNGAVKIEYHDPTLGALPVIQGLGIRCANDGPVPNAGSGGGVTPAPTPYGKAYAVDIASVKAIPLTSRAACLRATRQFAPGPYQVVAD